MDGTDTNPNTGEEELESQSQDMASERTPTASGDTQETPPETLTKAQAEEMARKAAHDALIKAGRTDKDLSAREQKLKDWEVQKEAEQAEKDKLALEELNDNPQAKSVLQRIIDREKKLRDKEKAVAEKERNIANSESDIQEAKKTKAEKAIMAVATQFKVDPTKLIDKVRLYSLEGNDEAIKDLARDMSQRSALRNDSALGAGSGSGVMTPERAKNLTAEEYAAERKKTDSTLK